MPPRVVYSCPYVPAEWIAAHGVLPHRLMPSTADASSAAPMTGVCPYARAFASAAERSGAAAVVVTSACDQMRRISDELRIRSRLPVFLLNLPHTWQTATSRGLYISELQRLGRFLVTLGGEAPPRERLIDIALQYDRDRAPLRSCAGEHGVPIALVGGPVMPDQGIHNLLEECGGWVALDATETGERGLPGPLDADLLRIDPLAAISQSYFEAIVDPFQRPNHRLFSWLKAACAERGVRGVVLLRYVWCDNWHAEAERLRTELGLPFLNLEMAGDGRDSARVRTRIQALMEVLR